MNINMLVRQRTQIYQSAESVVSVFTPTFPGQCMCQRNREVISVAFNCLHNDNHSSLLLYKNLQDCKHTYDKGHQTGRKNNDVRKSTMKLRLIFEQHDDCLHPLSKYLPSWQ